MRIGIASDIENRRQYLSAQRSSTSASCTGLQSWQFPVCLCPLKLGHYFWANVIEIGSMLVVSDEKSAQVRGASLQHWWCWSRGCTSCDAVTGTHCNQLKLSQVDHIIRAVCVRDNLLQPIGPGIQRAALFKQGFVFDRAAGYGCAQDVQHTLEREHTCK